jgi:hypothetical protein
MPRPPDGSGPAESLPRDESEETVSFVDVSQTPEEVLAYWTPERMALAKPREIRLPEAAGEPDTEREDN